MEVLSTALVRLSTNNKINIKVTCRARLKQLMVILDSLSNSNPAIINQESTTNIRRSKIT